MLEYKTRQSGEVTIIDLKGPITLSEALAHGYDSGEKSETRPTLVGEIIRRLLQQGHRQILLNLQDVSYVDSSGIGELVGAFTSVQGHGGQLKLLHPVAKVVNVLRLTRLDHLFPVETDEASAIQSFAQPG
ncbi:MAG: STAS domain-containing protein [Terriglobales bacterium]